MLPLSTTTYTVYRATNIDEDAGEALDFQPVIVGLPGNTVFLSGSESVVGGDRERVDARIIIEEADVRHFDHVLDDVTGDTWQVAFARRRTGLGLDHLVLGVYQTTGVARGTRDL
jgi:hypothetical protein